MATINRLSLKALLLDTITHLKTGNHLHDNYKVIKKEVCEQLGQKTNIKSLELLNGIGLIYKDNNLEADFWGTLDRMKATYLLDGSPKPKPTPKKKPLSKKKQSEVMRLIRVLESNSMGTDDREEIDNYKRQIKELKESIDL